MPATATGPVVWVISVHQWSRACLRAELIERGFQVAGYLDLAGALAEFRHLVVPRPALIVLDLSDQPLEPGDVAALVGSGVPAVLLGGAMELREELVEGHAWAGVLKRPFTIGDVADLVETILR